MGSYLNRCLQQAANKPSIASISQEHLFLGLILLLLAFEAGDYLSAPVIHPASMGANLACLGMLLMNTLAFQFKWSRAVTIVLRAGALAMLVLGTVMVFRLV